MMLGIVSEFHLLTVIRSLWVGRDVERRVIRAGYVVASREVGAILSPDWHVWSTVVTFRLCHPMNVIHEFFFKHPYRADRGGAASEALAAASLSWCPAGTSYLSVVGAVA